MVLPLTLFGMLAVVFVYVGVRLIRDPGGWGTGYVERTVPKVFKMGNTETHRLVLGWGYVLVGSLFLVVDIAFAATHF